MAQSDIDIKMAQCDSFNDIFEMGKFRFLGTQEFPACRNIIKEVSDLNGSATRMRSWFDIEFIIG